MTLVFVREELLGHALIICPSAFNYETVAEAESMYNTPPSFGIYVAGLVFQWVKGLEYAGQRGLAAIEQRNIDKAAPALFGPGRFGLLRKPRRSACRSRMNVPFLLRDEKLNETSSPKPRPRACCSSRATSRWAACAPRSTTRCRWKACRPWCPS